MSRVQTKNGQPAVYNSSAPTLADGDGSALNVDVNGNLKVVTPSGGSADQIQGNIASGATDSGNPVKAGGKYNSTPPVFVDGQRGDLQLDSSGRILTNDAPLTGTADSIAINDGTNTANVAAVASGQNGLITASGYKEITGLSAGSLNADLLPSTDVSAFSSVALMITGTYVGTVQAQYSNDNSNWFAFTSTYASGGAASGTQSSAATGMFRIVPVGRYMRVRMNAYTSGTATGVAEFYTADSRNPGLFFVSSAQNGTWTFQPGNTPNTTAWLANPTTDYPSGATPLTAASGNVAAATATATLAATGGKTTYITGFEVTGSGAVAGLPVTVTVTGVITGTMSYTYSAVAGVLLENNPLIVPFPKPIPASATNTTIVVSCPSLGTGNTNNTVNAHGYQL